MMAPSRSGFERLAIGLFITLLVVSTADAQRNIGKRKRQPSQGNSQMMHAEMPAGGGHSINVQTGQIMQNPTWGGEQPPISVTGEVVNVA